VKKRSKTIALILASVMTLCCSPAGAQAKVSDCSKGQKSASKSHITKQINALAKSDWKLAYSYAANSFQSSVSLDAFKEIITQQYFYLLSNSGFDFGACITSDNSFNQIVMVRYHGEQHVLSYYLTLVNRRLGVVAAKEVKPAGTTAA
jgi:Domain of unknown function (DUF4864)